jgi:ribosome biogenesis GTPase A
LKRISTFGDSCGEWSRCQVGVDCLISVFSLFSFVQDVLVQIVDARDPELFRCEDLSNYTKEIGADKISLLLLNKADLLTVNQRRKWASYYDSIGVKFFFFSAKQVEAPEMVEEEEEEHSS